jgi:hypothetical protein
MVLFPVGVLFSKAPDRLWGPPSSISNEYRREEVFSRGEKRLEPQVRVSSLCRSQGDGDK